MDGSQERRADDRTRLPRAVWVLGIALALAVRLIGVDDPWSGLGRDFRSHFGAFATGAPARGFADHGLLEARLMPYEWRVEVDAPAAGEPAVRRVWYAHHPPLFMWISGLALRWLGPDEWSLRVAPILLSLFSVWAVTRLVLEVWGARAAAVALLLHAVVPYSAHFAQQPWTEGAVVGTSALVVLWTLRWLRGGGGRALAAAAGWAFVGGLFDWPAHFVLPGLGVYVLVVLARRGESRRLGAALAVPAAAVATIALHKAHMLLAIPASAAHEDRVSTLDWVTTLTAPLPRFLHAQWAYLLRWGSWPIVALAGLGAAVWLARAARGRLRPGEGLLPVLALPAVWYVALFPARSINHEFFQWVGVAGLVAAAALGWLAIERALAACAGRAGRAGRAAALGLLLAVALFGVWRDLELWGRRRSDALVELARAPWLAPHLADEGAVLLTHYGLGMGLPFYAHAPVVHSVDDAARLENHLRWLAGLAPDRRVWFLVDGAVAPRLPGFGPLRERLAEAGEASLHRVGERRYELWRVAVPRAAGR